MASPVTLFPIDPAAEADRLADLFDGMSAALDDYRLGLPADIPEDQLKTLKDRAQDLEDRSHFFTAEAIGATLQSIAADLEKIKGVTAEAKAQVAVLNSVSKVIAIATSAVSLGTAIAEGNPGSIATCAQSLASSFSD